MFTFRIAVLFALMLPAVAFSQAARHASPDAQRAFAILSHADDEGLDSGRYAPPVGAGLHDPGVRDALELYMRDVSTGRPELEALDSDVSLPRSDSGASTLDAAMAGDNVSGLIAGLAPPYPDYAQLKVALARYRAIVARGGWPQLPDVTADDTSLLRQRLAFEDDKAVTEENLSDAVKRFQGRNGLAQDGVVGARTRAALNIPAAARVDTIIANMERWRWLPRSLEADRIWINVPDARLQFWLGGRVVLASRVVVGRPNDPTPILRAEGAGVTVNPPWNVPSSIAVKEILPKLRKNPAYLVSQNMVLANGPADDPQGLHIDWHAVSAARFPYRIRQKPGPQNALGRVKIELPNRFAVYLHDTPAKSAFDRPERDVSHGCVRVEQILPLASYVLGNAQAAKRIAAALQDGETRYFPAAKTLPVYFLYWTAFAGEDGVLQFRPDIYGRDARLIAAIKARAVQVAALAGCRRVSNG